MVLQELKRNGIHRRTIKRIPNFCQDAGLTDVSIHHKSIPIGWDGKVGEIMLDNILHLMKDYKGIENIIKEVEKNKCTANLYVFTGRKPMINENNDEKDLNYDEFSDMMETYESNDQLYKNENL